MATRKTAEPIIDPDSEPAEVPGIMPPPGVQAKVKTTVDYVRTVDPDTLDAGNHRGYDLDELAIEESETLRPPDPLAAFIETWGRYIGYNCEVVRLPDPADRRLPNSRYARSNFGEHERLGGIPFDPLTLQASIQIINGNSGGVFRLWLTDQYGQMIPGARLERLALADPIGAGHATSGQPSQSAQPGQGYGQPAPVITERPLSAMEKQMQQLQTRLLENALERAMNPAPTPPPQAPQLSPEQQLAIAVFTHGDLLGNVIQKAVTAVQVPTDFDRPTWKDKLIELAANNPTLVARVNDTVGRIADRLFSGGTAPAYQPPTQHAPQATPGAQAAADQFSNLPPDAPDADINDPALDEDEDMALLEDVVTLLSGNDPLTFDNPVFKELEREYPRRFPMYVHVIAQLPNTDAMLHMVAASSPLYATLLNGPMQAHYQKRAEELRQVCIEAIKPKAAPESEKQATAPQL